MSDDDHYDVVRFFCEALPRYPLCGDRQGLDFSRRPVDEALAFPLMQHSRHHQRAWIVVDIDRSNRTLTWEDKGLVPPNFAAINPNNGHAHVAWRLAAPVAHHATARAHPIAYAEAIRMAMTRALDGDTGYGNLLVKNPIHKRWRTYWWTFQTYSLEQLSEPFDTRDLRKVLKPVVDLGLGRNTTLFEALRRAAYHDVRRLKQDGMSRHDLFDTTMQRAHELNSELASPLPQPEITSIVKSVTKWSWPRFSPEEFSRIQKRRSDLATKARRAKCERLQEEIKARLSDMGDLTIPASDLAKEIGVTRQTIYNHVNKIRRKST